MSPTASAAPVSRHRLPNGLTVAIVENPAADIVAGRVFVRAGSLWEPGPKAGLAHLLAAVITKGTESRSSLDIADRVESLGAGLGTDASTDYFLLNFKTVTEDFETILYLAAELLRSPAFPEAEVDLERRIALQAIRAQQEQPFAVAFEQLHAAVYGDRPYGLPILGTEATARTLVREDLQAFHRAHFRPDNTAIALAGRLDRDRALARVAAAFGDWEAPDAPPPAPPRSTDEPLPEPRWVATPQDTQQSVVMLGYPAASVLAEAESAGDRCRPHPDYAALKLTNSYLGNGLSSRLFVELREKRGLAYEVSAFYPTRLDRSLFVTYMGTAPDNTPVALAGLRAETRRLQQTLLDEGELAAAKNKLLGQYALGKQTNAQLAQLYGWYEILGLGIEFDAQFQAEVAATSAADLRRVAERYFGEPYASLVGPAAAVAPLARS